MKKGEEAGTNQLIPYLIQIAAITGVKSSEILLKLMGLLKIFLKEIVFDALEWVVDNCGYYCVNFILFLENYVQWGGVGGGGGAMVTFNEELINWEEGRY